MWLFGVLFLIAGVIAFISPENTFAAIADILGFLFLIVGTVLDHPGVRRARRERRSGGSA